LGIIARLRGQTSPSRLNFGGRPLRDVRVAARPVDLSEDGHKIAVFVDVPEKRIQIGSADLPDQPAIYLPLGNCYPDEILFLQGGDELVTLEHRKAGGTSCVSLWNVGSGQRVAKHDFDYMTVNSFCRTGASRLIALGLDQSVVLINVGDGTVETQLKSTRDPCSVERSILKPTASAC
jgi:hypothetical protein